MLNLLLMLRPAMDMDMLLLPTDMVTMPILDILMLMDIMLLARGLLMLSLDMDILMDIPMLMDMDMDTPTDTDTLINLLDICF